MAQFSSTVIAAVRLIAIARPLWLFIAGPSIAMAFRPLIVITFGAAVINGALGYGFSSMTVPLALLFLTNRTLAPTVVLLELALNFHVLWLNRAALPRVWRRVLPAVIGLAPGVLLGTLVVARVNPSWLKLATYAVLLPLVLVQAAGYRRPVRAERGAGLAFGGGLGVLYAMTTISGPPLALALNNQEFSKHEFCAALGFVRLAESTLTAVAYLTAGLFVRESLDVLPWILPGVMAGVPLGTVMIRHVCTDTFRRASISFGVWVVSFGLSTFLRSLHVIDSVAAFGAMAAAIGIDSWLLYRFFSRVPEREVSHAG